MICAADKQAMKIDGHFTKNALIDVMLAVRIIIKREAGD